MSIVKLPVNALHLLLSISLLILLTLSVLMVLILNNLLKISKEVPITIIWIWILAFLLLLLQQSHPLLCLLLLWLLLLLLLLVVQNLWHFLNESRFLQQNTTIFKELLPLDQFHLVHLLFSDRAEG